MTVMTKDGIRPDIRPTLDNVTCVQGSGPFAVCDRAIFTAHAADSDSTDYRAMLARVRYPTHKTHCALAEAIAVYTGRYPMYREVCERDHGEPL